MIVVGVGMVKDQAVDNGFALGSVGYLNGQSTEDRFGGVLLVGGVQQRVILHGVAFAETFGVAAQQSDRFTHIDPAARHLAGVFTFGNVDDIAGFGLVKSFPDVFQRSFFSAGVFVFAAFA